MSSLYYLGGNHTSDIVIFNHLKQVLLIRRSAETDAFPNALALPGGFVNSDKPKGDYFQGTETSVTAAARELFEETNLQVNEDKLTFIGSFEGNNRDPRDNDTSWTVSSAFYYRVPKEDLEHVNSHLLAKDDAVDVSWVDVSSLNKESLAFDHFHIIYCAIENIKQKTQSKKVKP